MKEGKIIVTNKNNKSRPPNADFAIYIDFVKDAPNPQRVFQSAEALITAFQKLDHKLCRYIDSSIEPIMVLEEIETGSLRIWLKNILSATDDQGIKELNWKPLVGKYLVKAKYIIIDWVNKSQKDGNALELKQLSEDIQELALKTNVKFLPEYTAPSTTDLIESVQQLSAANSSLDKKDTLKYLDGDTEIEFDLSISWTPEDFGSMLTREIIKNPPTKMILTVKKPDYLGSSKWDLRHGRTPIFAKIEDADWLNKFQSRNVDVRPGDSLRCEVVQTLHYGYDNELISYEYSVIRVEEILTNQYEQLILDPREEGSP